MIFLRNHDEFKMELMRRKSEFDQRRHRRARILTRSICAVLCLCLVLSFAMTPATVNAEDLLAGYTPNPVTGKAPDDAFTAAQMDFALKLLKGSYDGENTLISPLSATLALSMAANGAGGNTLAQMEEVLCGGMDIEEWNKYLYYYVNHLPTSDAVKMHLANSIWYDSGANLTVRPAFLQTVADYYNADLYAAPFNDETVGEINKWISQNTDGLIDQALDELSSIMYLVNALVFDGKWHEPYSDNDISDRPFHNADGSTKIVDMMFSKEGLYLETESATGFMKDYAGSDYRFVAILPNEDLTLTEYLESLTAEDLTALLNSARRGNVQAGLPQFEYEFDISLIDVLQDLGITDAFDPGRADLSPMATIESNNLFLGQLIHKTFISVDAKGTKAAATTIVGIAPTTAAPIPFTVILDRPFLYMIVDTQTNLPIFLGAVTDLG